MPQLNKGGKYVFGLSAISNRREILFPAETLEQYPVQKEGRIIIFTGSKITGGFCVTSKQLLGQSKLKHILDDCPALSQYTIDEGEFVRYKGRGYTWLHISQNGVVRLPENTMRYLNLSCGDILMSIKSSDIAFTMGARGPLMDKVHSYPGHSRTQPRRNKAGDFSTCQRESAADRQQPHGNYPAESIRTRATGRTCGNTAAGA